MIVSSTVIDIFWLFQIILIIPKFATSVKLLNKIFFLIGKDHGAFSAFICELISFDFFAFWVQVFIPFPGKRFRVTFEIVSVLT